MGVLLDWIHRADGQDDARGLLCSFRGARPVSSADPNFGKIDFRPEPQMPEKQAILLQLVQIRVRYLDFFPANFSYFARCLVLKPRNSPAKLTLLSASTPAASL